MCQYTGCCGCKQVGDGWTGGGIFCIKSQPLGTSHFVQAQHMWRIPLRQLTKAGGTMLNDNPESTFTGWQLAWELSCMPVLQASAQRKAAILHAVLPALRLTYSGRLCTSMVVPLLLPSGFSPSSSPSLSSMVGWAPELSGSLMRGCPAARAPAPAAAAAGDAGSDTRPGSLSVAPLAVTPRCTGCVVPPTHS